MAEHGHGTALIFARTETRWWHRSIWPAATAILFMAGRINFHHPDGTRAKGNAGAPTALIAYGDDDADRLAGSDIDGHVVMLVTPRYFALAATDETWAEVVRDAMGRLGGRARLNDLYRAIAAHPKRAATNTGKRRSGNRYSAPASRTPSGACGRSNRGNPMADSVDKSEAWDAVIAASKKQKARIEELEAQRSDLIVAGDRLRDCANAVSTANPGDPDSSEAFEMFDEARRQWRLAALRALEQGESD